MIRAGDDCQPPLAVNLYVAANLAKITLEAISWAAIPCVLPPVSGSDFPLWRMRVTRCNVQGANDGRREPGWRRLLLGIQRVPGYSAMVEPGGICFWNSSSVRRRYVGGGRASPECSPVGTCLAAASRPEDWGGSETAARGCPC